MLRKKKRPGIAVYLVSVILFTVCVITLLVLLLWPFITGVIFGYGIAG